MKLRHKGEVEKIEAQMAPMSDVVFQLLIFFMLTLKILAPEGDFNINMPIGQARADEQSDPQLDIKVRLLANPDGTLNQVALGTRSLSAAWRSPSLSRAAPVQAPAARPMERRAPRARHPRPSSRSLRSTRPHRGPSLRSRP